MTNLQEYRSASRRRKRNKKENGDAREDRNNTCKLRVSVCLRKFLVCLSVCLFEKQPMLVMITVYTHKGFGKLISDADFLLFTRFPLAHFATRLAHLATRLAHLA